MIHEISKKKKKEKEKKKEDVYISVNTRFLFIYYCIIMVRKGEVPINVYKDLRSKILKKK